MAPAKKTKPWAVVLTTSGGPIRTEHRSEPETYRKVAEIRKQITNGSSRVTRIRVEKWSRDYGRWELFETAYPEDS